MTSLAIDGRQPALALSPDSPDAVAAAVGMAAEHGAAVSPYGNGTKVGLGNPPQRYDVALRLHTLDQVLEYEPADLTVTVQAGIRLSAVQRQLATAGQFLALDPAPRRRGHHRRHPGDEHERPQPSTVRQRPRPGVGDALCHRRR